MDRVRLVVYLHLMWTGVMAGLTLLLSMRFPYPETTTWFRITLALLAACALAVVPLLGGGSLSRIWLPFVAFVAATLSFVVFSVQVIRVHIRRLQRPGRPLNPDN